MLPGTHGEKEMSKLLKGLFLLLIGERPGSRVIYFSINSEFFFEQEVGPRRPQNFIHIRRGRYILQ